jgi:hypothetical protein
MPVSKYEVWLLQSANDLISIIQVISISEENAKELVLRQFFPGGGWEIMQVKALGEINSRKEHVL